MKIGFASDLHGFQPIFEECDIIALAGDLTHKGDYWKTREFNNYVEEYLIYRAKDVVYIAGNHDFWYEKQKVVPFKKESSDYLGTIHYLCNSSREIQGIKFWGTPNTVRFHDWAFNSSEEELYDIFSRCPEDTDIILSHGPCRGILDSSARDDRLGSISAKLIVEAIKPKIFVSGHIHQSAGQIRINDTLFINASYVDDKYKPTRLMPVYLEWENL